MANLGEMTGRLPIFEQIAPSQPRAPIRPPVRVGPSIYDLTPQQLMSEARRIQSRLRATPNPQTRQQLTALLNSIQAVLRTKK